MDTILVFEIKLKEELTEEQQAADVKKITEWLKIRVKDSTIQVREVK